MSWRPHFNIARGARPKKRWPLCLSKLGRANRSPGPNVGRLAGIKNIAAGSGEVFDPLRRTLQRLVGGGSELILVVGRHCRNSAV
jgi:hypothetical protein